MSIFPSWLRLIKFQEPRDYKNSGPSSAIMRVCIKPIIFENGVGSMKKIFYKIFSSLLLCLMILSFSANARLWAGGVGFIDKTGMVVIPPKFDEVNPFSEGLAAVQIEGKWGFIDKTGNMVIRPQFDDIGWSRTLEPLIIGGNGKSFSGQEV